MIRVPVKKDEATEHVKSVNSVNIMDNPEPKFRGGIQEEDFIKYPDKEINSGDELGNSIYMSEEQRKIAEELHNKQEKLAWYGDLPYNKFKMRNSNIWKRFVDYIKNLPHTYSLHGEIESHIDFRIWVLIPTLVYDHYIHGIVLSWLCGEFIIGQNTDIR